MANSANPPKASLKSRRKNRRTVTAGHAYIFTSFSNTIIMISDPQGNALTIASAGSCGFRGARKKMAHAAQVTAHQVANTAIKNFGLKRLKVFVKGVGQGRESALRTLLNKDLQIDSITDRTTIPHGGVRPRKARRT